VVVPSSIIAEPVTAAQESTWSARSAASTNDVDAGKRWRTIGNEEGTGGSSTLSRTPQTPQKAVAKRVQTTDPSLQPETFTSEREPQL